MTDRMPAMPDIFTYAPIDVDWVGLYIGPHLIVEIKTKEIVDKIRGTEFGEAPQEMAVDEKIESSLHSDCGGVGVSVNCSDCNQRIVFADGGWWRTECECGHWEQRTKYYRTPHFKA